MKNKFSIIICGFNEERFLKRCLTSCISQNYPKDKYEIVYIDNNSRDRSLEIAKKFKNIKSFVEKRQGLSEARNCGINKTNGEIIVFLDADTKLDKNYLLKQERIFMNDKIGAGGGKVLPMKNKVISNYLGVSLFESYPRYIKNRFVRTYPGCNLTIRRKVINKIGIFKENFEVGEVSIPRLEDKEICMRIRREGYLIQYNKEAIIYHKNREKLNDLIKLWFRGAKSRRYMINNRSKDVFSQVFRYNLPLIYLLLICISLLINLKIAFVLIGTYLLGLYILSIRSFIETNLIGSSILIKPFLDSLSMIIINLGTLYYKIK